MHFRSKKYGLSCLVCRRRKVKCDDSRPNCANCVRLNERCNYNVQDPTITRLQNTLLKSERHLWGLEQTLRSLLVLEPKQCQDELRQILTDSAGTQARTSEASRNTDDATETAEISYEIPLGYTDDTHEEVS